MFFFTNLRLFVFIILVLFLAFFAIRFVAFIVAAFLKVEVKGSAAHVIGGGILASIDGYFTTFSLSYPYLKVVLEGMAIETSTCTRISPSLLSGSVFTKENHMSEYVCTAF